MIQLTVDYAPPHYPQYKGKIKRFFRTACREMPHAQVAEMATELHDLWIEGSLSDLFRMEQNCMKVPRGRRK
jgi:hypothetical protein